MLLTYQAVDKNGERRSDTVEADSTNDALDLLRRRGLYVTRVAEVAQREKAVRTERITASKVRVPIKTLTLLTRQMAMLLRAGSGLVPSYMAIARQMHSPRHKALLHRIVADLEEGSTLTDALRRHPTTFDAVYCAIVAAGEASASLDGMFHRLSLMLGKRRAIRKKVLGTLAYPALLVVMCTGIINTLLFFVLPRFADMFLQLGVEVPTSTKALLSLGSFVRDYWPVLLAGIAGGVICAVLALRTAAGQRWLSNVQTSIPLVGGLRSKLIQGQLLRTMGMLIESRVGLMETLELAGRSTNNNRFRALFEDLEEEVTSGGQLSASFERSGIVDHAICQAIRTGEESGNLGEAMTYCADVLDESNEELINVMAKLIEPAILLGMGMVVGAVAISLFLPLFDLTSAIN